MPRVHRFDRAELRPPQKRADGSVRYDAVLSRVGVFSYKRADGTTRREYRSPEEVGRADSLASLELTPVTDGHPAKPGMAKKCAVGSVGDNVKFDGRHVTASLVVLNDAVNERIARGDMRELSPGYTVDLDETPGVTPEGEAYDVKQTNIIYEHQALVPFGRQGSTVALRTDAADWHADAAVQVSSWGQVTASVTSAKLSQVALEQAVRTAVESAPGMYLRTDAAERKDAAGIEVIGGWADSKGAASCTVSTRDLSLDDLIANLKAGLASADVSIGDATAPAVMPPRTDRADARMEPIMDELQKKLTQALADLAAATVRADNAEQKLRAETSRADKAEGDRDAAKDRADRAEKERTDAAANAPTVVRARILLETQAAPILGSEVKFDGMDDTAIKAAVVAKLTGKDLPSDKAKSADYVAARFDAAMELAGESAAAGAGLREAVTPPTKPGERVDAREAVADARTKMLDRNKTAGDKPLNGSN